ncbi:MAG: hypothetical protein AABZ47_05725 [Planctomycetota bacterium]
MSGKRLRHLRLNAATDKVVDKGVSKSVEVDHAARVITIDDSRIIQVSPHHFGNMPLCGHRGEHRVHSVHADLFIAPDAKGLRRREF